MYDSTSVKKYILENGVDATISTLLNPELSTDEKNSLAERGFFPGGFLNISLIYSLAQ